MPLSELTAGLNNPWDEPQEKTKRYAPFCVTLIGMPGMGKSTWAKSFRNDTVTESGFRPLLLGLDGFMRVQREMDSFEEDIHREQTTYAELFSMYKERANVAMSAAVASSTINNDPELSPPSRIQNVIVDSTNITLAKRQLIREVYFPKTVYRHYAVFFKAPSWEEVCRVNDERMARGRSIPPEVLEEMYATYLAEADNFLNTEEVKNYSKVWVPTFSVISDNGRFYD